MLEIKPAFTENSSKFFLKVFLKQILDFEKNLFLGRIYLNLDHYFIQNFSASQFWFWCMLSKNESYK